MITTLTNFLLLEENDHRSVRITFEDVKRKILSIYNNPEEIKNVYRGIKDTIEYKYINPKLFYRKSYDTKNYYNLWIDNNEKWSEYPKRSQSLICSTNKNKVVPFGTRYLVVPLNKDSNFGVCKTSDIWLSFSYLFSKFNNTPTMEEFNYLLKKLDISDHSYEEMIKDLTYIENDNLDLKYYLKDINMKIDFNDLLNPVKNNFQISKYEELENYLDNEVWTDSECILIKIENTDYSLQEIKNEIFK